MKTDKKRETEIHNQYLIKRYGKKEALALIKAYNNRTKRKVKYLRKALKMDRLKVGEK